MSGIGERLKLLRNTLGLSQEEFARKLNKTKRAIQYWEKEKVFPPRNAIQLIKQVFNVNPQWLLEGKGQMFLEQCEVNLPQGLPIDIELFNTIIEVILGEIKSGRLELTDEEFLDLLRFVYVKVKPLKKKETKNWDKKIKEMLSVLTD